LDLLATCRCKLHLFRLLLLVFGSCRHVESIYLDGGIFAPRVRVLYFGGDGALFPGHQRDVVVAIDRGKDAIATLCPHRPYLQHQRQRRFNAADLLDAPPSGLLSSGEFLYPMQAATAPCSMMLLVFRGNGRNDILKTLRIEKESLNRSFVRKAPESLDA
jgi:hypothetical protein